MKFYSKALTRETDPAGPRRGPLLPEEGELISLNAQTGIPNPRFGNDGYVDLKTPDVMNDFPNMHYGISSVVAIYEHLVFTGVHNADETGSKGPAGDVRAWDLRTGELGWTFHSVPRPGEPIPAALAS